MQEAAELAKKLEFIDCCSKGHLQAVRNALRAGISPDCADVSTGPSAAPLPRLDEFCVACPSILSGTGTQRCVAVCAAWCNCGVSGR